MRSELPHDGSFPEEVGCAPLSQWETEHEVVDDDRLSVSVSLQLEAYDALGSEELLRVDATFRVLYSVPDMSEHSHEDFQCFARLNGTFNVWPYWRELVQTTGNRVGLSDLVIPVFRPHEQ